MIIVPYFGEVGIAAWEWLLGIVYIMVLYLYFGRVKNMRIKKEPEYRHFLWGLYAKMLGGVAFSMIYFYYYGGGDTTSYFFSGLSMSHLALADFPAYLKVLFGPNDHEHIALFSGMDSKPLDYIYRDTRTFMLVRIISPVILFSFNSYLITTLLISSICYIGLWRCFQTMISYFPSLTDKFAVAFLYVPSVLFWGSGILKDTVTISAACWWLHCADELFFKRRNQIFNSTGLLFSAYLLIMIKPYVLMALLPMTVLWILYFRVLTIRNALMRVSILPFSLLVMLGASYWVLMQLGDGLGKFSLDQALETTQVLQADLSRSEQYGSNYFDIGDFDGTLIGAVKLAPVVINAALFRPYLWEADSLVVAISALENAILLGITLWVLLYSGPWFFMRATASNPLVLLCIIYAMLFAFMVGFTTPNFGALVRFKIPMLPLYISGLFIIYYLKSQARSHRRRGRRFDMSLYRRGEPISH